MNAGYERVGKSAAAGGAYISFDIISQRIGENNSQAEVQVVWRHVVGEEGDCHY